MQTEASPLESADTHDRAKSNDLAQTCFGAPPGVGDCPGDNPETIAVIQIGKSSSYMLMKPVQTSAFGKIFQRTVRSLHRGRGRVKGVS